MFPVSNDHLTDFHLVHVRPFAYPAPPSRSSKHVRPKELFACHRLTFDDDGGCGGCGKVIGGRGSRLWGGDIRCVVDDEVASGRGGRAWKGKDRPVRMVWSLHIQPWLSFHNR